MGGRLAAITAFVAAAPLGVHLALEALHRRGVLLLSAALNSLRTGRRPASTSFTSAWSTTALSEAEQTKPPGMASTSTASAGNLRIAAVTVSFGSTVSAP
jgi:hypothetical protein